MPFVPVPNTVMVEAVYEWAGQTVENTMYFEATVGAPTEGSISDLLDNVRTVIETELLPLLSTGIQLVRMVGTLLTAIDALSVTLSVNPPAAGGVPDEAMPNNVSYVVSFLTSQRGRSFRGRNYVPGLPQTAVTGNDITPGARTALLSFYETLAAAVVADEWLMVVVSRFSLGQARTTGVTSPIIAFTTYDTVVDSQRRRLPGRGN